MRYSSSNWFHVKDESAFEDFMSGVRYYKQQYGPDKHLIPVRIGEDTEDATFVFAPDLPTVTLHKQVKNGKVKYAFSFPDNLFGYYQKIDTKSDSYVAWGNAYSAFVRGIQEQLSEGEACIITEIVRKGREVNGHVSVITRDNVRDIENESLCDTGKRIAGEMLGNGQYPADFGGASY